jgi:hypothetical protein
MRVYLQVSLGIVTLALNTITITLNLSSHYDGDREVTSTYDEGAHRETLQPLWRG